MALPEDDVEEVDPEPALAQVLDHEHDALVIGPGLRPSLAIADSIRLLLTLPQRPPGPVVLDAEALRASHRPMAGRTGSARRASSRRTRRVTLDCVPGAVPPAAQRRGPLRRRRGACPGRSRGRGRVAPGRRAQGRAHGDREPPEGATAVAPFEPSHGVRRHRRRPRRRDRGAPRSVSPRSTRPGWASTSMASRRRGGRADRRRRAPGGRPPGGAPDQPQASRRSPSGSAAVGGSASAPGSTDPVPDAAGDG